MGEIKLRPYQMELIDGIKAELRRGNRTVLAVLGCGGGKSIIQAMIARAATEKGNRVIFVVHRQELCAQIEATFISCGVDMDRCEVCMIQTLCRQLDEHEAPALILIDEAHRSTAASYMKLFEAYPEAIRIGFTATPTRLGNNNLGVVYTSLVRGVETRWLIDNRYLADYRYYTVKLADTSSLHTKHGDYDASEVAELMENHAIYGETVSQYRKIADGKKAICYCASVQASKDTAKAFLESGIPAAHVDGSTPEDERRSAMEDFRAGRIRVICNANLYIEGLDVPDCEVSILLRPTKSLTIFIQAVMRCMRYYPGKTAIIIDHVGACFYHGLPDDVREWELSEGKGKRDEFEVKIKQCPMCFACFSASEDVCPECGYRVDVMRERRGQDVVEVDLAEVRREEFNRRRDYRDYRSFTSWDELEAFRKARGYKFGWSIRKAREVGISIPSKYRYTERYHK